MRRVLPLLAALLCFSIDAAGAQTRPAAQADIELALAILQGGGPAPARTVDATCAAVASAGPQSVPMPGRGDYELAQSSCPAGYPLACPGTNDCCPANTPYLCRNLTCRHPEGTVPVGWSGCVGPRTNESFRFWSSCCSLWQRCG